MSKMNKLLENQIKKWLKFAKEDFQVAQITFEKAIYNSTCFHCQQAIEKIFKSILLKRKKTIPKIHSLEKLRLELEEIEPVWRKFKKETRFLDQFYVPTRYPDAIPGNFPEGLPNEKDAKKSIEVAEKIIKEAEKQLV